MSDLDSPPTTLLALQGIDCRVDGMADDDPNETDAEQRHRLWWGVRGLGPAQWVSLCVVLAMVAGLFWLAIHFSKPPGF